MRRVYQGAFAAGVLLLLLAITLGLYRSLALEGRIPSPKLSDLVESHLERIRERMDEGDHDTAIAQLRLTLKLMDRNQHLTHNMLGNALLDSGDTDGAIRHFREAVRLTPGFAEAHNNLGVALARRGSLDAAIAQVHEALAIDPYLASATRNLESMTRQAETRERQEAAGDVADEILLGRACVRQLYRGELEQLRERFDESFASRMSLDALLEMRRTVERQLGPETEVLEERLVPLQDSSVYLRRARFENHDGVVEVLVQIGDGETISGLMLRPAEDAAAQQGS